MPAKSDRAVVFVDGNNWYHSMRHTGVKNTFRLSYAKISEKLLGPRKWIGTRYYIGQLDQDWDRRSYADQRRFLAEIRKEDSRITVHLGRLERRRLNNPIVRPLLKLLDNPDLGIGEAAKRQITRLTRDFSGVEILKEKAVDIMLAQDMLLMAMEDK